MLQGQRLNDRTLPAGIFFGVLAALIWGAWPVVTRLGVQQALSPADLTALRFAVAGLLLLPVVWRRGAAGIGWPWALVLAAGAGVPYVLTTALGLTYAPAGHAGVIVPGCMMTFTMLGSWLWLGDRPGRVRLAGYGLILVGILLIGWRSLSEGHGSAWIGDLLFVGSGLLWASYTVASKARGADPIQATALVSVLSLVLYLPAYLLIAGPGVLTAWTPDVLVQALYQGLLAGILALLFYSKAVHLLGAARGAVFAALVPGTAVLLALPILGEVPGALEISGLALVTFGMFWALGLVGQRRS